MRTKSKRILSLILSLVMIISVAPLSAFASYGDYKSNSHDVYKHTESTLAPGVDQYINEAFAKDGKRMVYYVAVADVNRDDVYVQTAYRQQHENGVMGMEKLSNEMAFANEKYSNPNDEHFISTNYNVVAGSNASFYDMTTGQPVGTAYIDGVSFGTKTGYPFFAILKDGTAIIDDEKNVGKYQIDQAVSGNTYLVKDGRDVTGSSTDRASRTCVGITAEGKVVIMVLDGRQEPRSCGGTMHELAQIMLEAGCVKAVNLDGGGSTTYCARPEGSDSVQVINNPSDGSERSISAGLMIASTAAPTDVFDHVSFMFEDEYVTPGTSTDITVKGVSAVGTSAEIPADISYSVSNGTYENGVLTASDVGDVKLTALYGGQVVGETTVKCVIPDSLTFNSAGFVAPYGKSIELGLTAKYGLSNVKFKASDFSLNFASAEIGTLDGLNFTALPRE